MLDSEIVKIKPQCEFCLEGFHELKECWAYMKIKRLSASKELMDEAVESWLFVIKH